MGQVFRTDKSQLKAAIVVFGFFFALSLSVAGSVDFLRARNIGAAISWISPAGSGISVPACGSSSVSSSCVGGSPVVVISWGGEECHGGGGLDLAVGLGADPDGLTISPVFATGSAGGCPGAFTWDIGDTWGGYSGPAHPQSNTTYYWHVAPNNRNIAGSIIANGSFTTPNCVSSGGGAPVAEAGISSDGSSFGTSISVIRGIPADIWFSADRDVTGDGLGSRDPDGWTNPTDGVSNGGKCDWNIDLVKPGFAVQRTLSDPASPAACNLGPFAKIFNDTPGTYVYEVLRITDAAAKVSEIATVFVTVTSRVSVSLIANPPIINPGGTSVLTWDTEGFGPGDCAIDRGLGSVPPDGSRPVSPASTTTYTLSCSDGVDSASTQATVYVATTPTIEEIPPR